MVPCDSGPGLPALSRLTEASSLTDSAHRTMGQNQVLTMVPGQIQNFPIFSRELILCLTWILERMFVLRPEYDQIQQASRN